MKVKRQLLTQHEAIQQLRIPCITLRKAQLSHNTQDVFSALRSVSNVIIQHKQSGLDVNVIFNKAQKLSREGLR